MKGGQRKSIRLLFLINSLRVSGTEVLMTSLAQELSERGCAVYLFPLITPFDKRFQEHLKSKSSVKVLFPNVVVRFDSLFWRINGACQRLLGWSFRDFFLRRYLSRCWRRYGFDVVVSNTYPADLLCVDLLKEIRTRLVVIDHGAYCNFLATGQPFRSEGLFAADVVVAVSQWARSMITNRFPDLRVSMIYNGHPGLTSIGRSFWFTSLLRDTSHFTFCIHGRASAQKGFDIALKAYERTRAKGYKVRLLILSDGELIDQLKLQHRNDSNVIFGGFIYDLGDVLPFVHAGLVLSKHSESFGLSVLDYFSVAKPVVASNIGGIPEVVSQNNRSGGILITSITDGEPSLDEVVSAMQRLIDDTGFYQKCRTDAMEIVKGFSMQKCSSQYYDLFRQLAGETFSSL